MFEARFQTFEEPETGVALGARLAALREELARQKLTGFVIPRADQQQNEYVAPSEERLAWLTGFTGSAGMAIVLAHEAAIDAVWDRAIQPLLKQRFPNATATDLSEARAYAYGGLQGVWAVNWITFWGLMIFNTLVLTGDFDRFKSWLVHHATADIRIQTLMLAWAFGALLEGRGQPRGVRRPLAVRRRHRR